MNVDDILENILGDEVERTITEFYLDNYKDFKFYLARLKPTEEIYQKLKEEDNWALYDNIDEWDKYYPNWRERLKKEYERIAKKEKDPIEAEMAFLESSELSDASARIASGILVEGIKDLKRKEALHS